MNLHRHNGADYNKKPYHELNNHGKVAKLSKGILTVANAVSLLGAVSTIYGAREVAKGKTKKGLFWMAAGRYADILDGKISDKNGTKGPVGEFVDAGLDKLVMGAVSAIFFKHNIVRRKVLGAYIVQNVANVGLSAVAKSNGNEIHPSMAGKLNTFGSWAEMLVEVIAHDLQENGRQEEADLAYRTANVLAVASIGLGMVATRGYKGDAFAEKPV